MPGPTQRFRVVFLHGLESGPHGSKYHWLTELGLGEVLAPDCTGILDPLERLARIRDALREEAYLLLVGSSFGGLMALRYASQYPDQVAGVVLCAPAVHRPEWQPPPPPKVPLAVLHGARDEVVPLQAVRDWAGWSAPVTVVDDDHRLHASRAEFERLVRETYARLTPPYQMKQRDALTPSKPGEPKYRRLFVHERGPDVERWQAIRGERRAVAGMDLAQVRRNALLGRCQLRVTHSYKASGMSDSWLLMLGFDHRDADGMGTIAVPASHFRGVGGNWVAVAWLDRFLKVEPVREFAPGMLAIRPAVLWQAELAPAVSFAQDFVALLRDPDLREWPADWFVSQLGSCARCGKDLTDPESQADGVGPECREILLNLPAVRTLYACIERKSDEAIAAAWNSGVEELVRLGLADAKPVDYAERRAEQERERLRREAYEAAEAAERAARDLALRRWLAAKKRAATRAANEKAKAKRQRAAKKAAKTRAANKRAKAKAAKSGAAEGAKVAPAAQVKRARRAGSTAAGKRDSRSGKTDNRKASAGQGKPDAVGPGKKNR